MTLAITWSSEETSESAGEFVSSFTEHELRFDAVTTETHEMTAVVTEHSVEGRAAISDHKRPDPQRLTIEATVSNTPTGDVVLPSGYASFSGGGGTVKPQGPFNTLQFDQSFDRVLDVFETLRRLAREPTLVTVSVSTGLTVYENMTVVSVNIPRDATDGASLKFTIDLIEVRIAETTTVDSPEPRETRGSRQQNSGTQETEDAESEGSEANRSIAAEYNDRVDAGESRMDAMRGALGF